MSEVAISCLKAFVSAALLEFILWCLSSLLRRSIHHNGLYALYLLLFPVLLAPLGFVFGVGFVPLGVFMLIFALLIFIAMLYLIFDRIRSFLA